MGKHRLSRRFARALRLPADAAMPVPRLEVTGRDDILVTGGAELTEFGPELICFVRDGCEVRINGTDLRIEAMDQLGMQIYGVIESIEFREEAPHAAALS